MKEDKEFIELIKSKKIDCLICQLTIGDAKAAIEHMMKRHPDVYKEFAFEVSPELYKKEMEERKEK